MPDDSIMLRFGGDTGAVATALRGLRGLVEKAVEPMGAAFSRFVIPLDLVGGLERIKSAFTDVLDNVKQIERVGGATGLGSEQWQKFAFTLEEVGGSAEQGEKNLTHFSALIGQAHAGVQSAKDTFTRWGVSILDANGKLKSVSTLIPEISSRLDQFASAEDRAAMGSDLFGKGFDKTLAALKALKEGAGDHQPFITDAEIANIKEAGIEVDKLSAKWRVFKAQMISVALDVDRRTNRTGRGDTHDAMNFLSLAFRGTDLDEAENARADWVRKQLEISERRRALRHPSATAGTGAVPVDVEGQRAMLAAMRERRRLLQESGDAELTGQEKIHAMEADRADLQGKMDMTSTTMQEKAKLLVEIAQKDLEIAKAKHQQMLDTVDVQNRMRDADTAFNHAVRSARERLTDPYASTLEKLAARATWHNAPNPLQSGYWSGGWAYRTAATIQRGTEQLSQYRENYGSSQYTTDWASRLQGMREQLSQAGYLPSDHGQEVVNDNIAHTREAMQRLVTMAEGRGINIVPHNSE